MLLVRLLLFSLIFHSIKIKAQLFEGTNFQSLSLIDAGFGVKLTVDEPASLNPKLKTKVIIYALPNGNSSAQTFGKLLNPGDDWHFDIQHIGAQTKFIRQSDSKSNYIVIYAENEMKSWPSWRKLHSDSLIKVTLDKIYEKYHFFKPTISLAGHSGGGSFIFGYLNSVTKIPDFIERIVFIDANYAYNQEKHFDKICDWLKTKSKSLQVIAYNDSVVVYNGKPLVSSTGGTWYISQLMASQLAKVFPLTKSEISEFINYRNDKLKVCFKLLKNPNGQIFHTVLVERNGFIDAIFNQTKFEGKSYLFWGDRAYQKYIVN